MLAQSRLPQLKLFLTLVCGIIVGFSFSQLLHRTNNIRFSFRDLDPTNYQHDHDYAEAVEDELVAEESALLFNITAHQDNRTLADFLHNETRVLCWILTSPSNHEKRAIHVKNTWGSRCNKLIFMSSEENTALGAVKLDVAEGRGNLWQKTRLAMKYIYEHHFDDADWFLKADDDTYVIVENLRVFLHQFSTESPVYFGCKFKPLVRQGYMSGGAGYVLSKEALRRFMKTAYNNSKICRQRNGGAEDKEIGVCLQNVGVVAGDSRDDQKRGRFFPSAPVGHLFPKVSTSWYWRYIFYLTEDGLNCCSDYAVSFHYLSPHDFYVMDYLIYKLRPFGITHKPEHLPPKSNMSELLDKWRNEKSDNPR